MKKSKLIRMIALVLALTMLLGMLSIGALADSYGSSTGCALLDFIIDVIQFIFGFGSSSGSGSGAAPVSTYRIIRDDPVPLFITALNF